MHIFGWPESKNRSKSKRNILVKSTKNKIENVWLLKIEIGRFWNRPSSIQHQYHCCHEVCYEPLAYVERPCKGSSVIFRGCLEPLPHHHAVLVGQQLLWKLLGIEV